MSYTRTDPASSADAVAASSEAVDATEEITVVEEHRPPKKRLVVIDDQPPVSAYRSTARQMGVVVVFVERAQDALRTVLQERPDGVILDLRLPDGDGRDLLALFKSSPEIASIPVVIVSGCLRPFEENTCFDLGAAAVEEKPVALRRVMAQAMGIRQLDS